MHPDDSLQQIRSQIEKTDEQIVLLLAERQTLIHNLALIKKAQKLPCSHHSDCGIEKVNCNF